MGVEGPGSERGLGLGLGLGLKMDEVLPSLPVLFAILVSGVLTRVSTRMMRVEELIMGAGTGAGAGIVGRGVLMTKACVLHVGVGVLCGVGVIGTCFLTERKEVMQFVSLVFSRRSKRKVE
ncbi:Rft-1-domain-containing protein [Pyrrhoderma noxium]|uniref:Rft-1-domain-containing protein n=1 Tax=Pyrrhoderma noxium TaxID=2282107 RepID=A0A286UAK3_9AGAM|nr:Rft-1-domain-containing protein [Pyrrhoderma noxium]